MIKLILLGVVAYFVYRFMWRDSSLQAPKQDKPFIKKTNSEEENIEDAEYTEK